MVAAQPLIGGSQRGYGHTQAGHSLISVPKLAAAFVAATRGEQHGPNFPSCGGVGGVPQLSYLRPTIDRAASLATSVALRQNHNLRGCGSASICLSLCGHYSSPPKGNERAEVSQ